MRNHVLPNASVVVREGSACVALSGTDHSANMGRGVGSAAKQVDTLMTLCSSEMRDFLRLPLSLDPAILWPCDLNHVNPLKKKTQAWSSVKKPNRTNEAAEVEEGKKTKQEDEEKTEVGQPEARAQSRGSWANSRSPAGDVVPEFGLAGQTVGAGTRG